MAKRRKRKLKTGVKVFFVFILVLLIGGGYYLFYGSGVELDKYYDEIAANFKNNSNEYKKCLASSDFNEDYFSEKLGNIRDEMIGMFESDANFAYEDLDSGYTFGKEKIILLMRRVLVNYQLYFMLIIWQMREISI